MKVSVIITTKNEEKNILNCLKSIIHQSYKNIEIIVVDNYSTDKTKKIALDFKKKFHVLNYMFLEFGPERSAQRNYGASKASGKYYLYLDADMILSTKVIEKSVNTFKNAERHNQTLYGLYIPEIIIGRSFWSKVRSFERSFYNATSIDCVRFLPLTIFHKIKGFDESMSGPEDWDFDKKIRSLGKVSIINAPLYHNEAEFNLSKYLGKKSYYINSFKSYINKWGKDDVDIKKQFGPTYRYLIVFIENGKWKNLIKHPILTLGIFFLRLLVGIIYFYSILK